MLANAKRAMAITARLNRLTFNDADQVRAVFSELIGRKVVIVANLAPRKLRGLESQGMIVAASLEGGPPVLAGFLEDVPIGARLK